MTCLLLTDFLLILFVGNADKVVRNHDLDNKQGASRLEAASGNHRYQKVRKHCDGHETQCRIESERIEEFSEFAHFSSLKPIQESG